MTNAQKNLPMLKVTGLWAKSSVKGGQYLTGRLGGVKVLIMENRDRQSDADPSHNLFFVEAPDRRQSAAERPQERSGGAGARTTPAAAERISDAARRLPWAQGPGARPSGAARLRYAGRAGVGTVRRPEEQLHRAVVQLLQVYQGRGLLTFCHVPNGGWRSPAEAAALKALGTMPGVPDLLIWLPGGGHFQVELKAGSGKLSAHQSAWISRMTDMGIAVHVIRSLDGLEALLRAEGVPPVGTLASAADAKARGDADVQERAR